MDPDRRAFERDIVTRAMQHDCVLYRNARGETVAFAWRSGDEQVGPEFAVRDLAVDWMAQRLNGHEGATDEPEHAGAGAGQGPWRFSAA